MQPFLVVGTENFNFHDIWFLTNVTTYFFALICVLMFTADWRG